MPHLTVRPFEPTDAAPAAALLAARHIRDRGRLPMLRADLEQASVCEEVIRRLAARSRVTGAVASDGDRMLGFLFGERMLFGPSDYAAMYFEPRSISIPIDGHAVAEDADATVVYRALYGELAAEWARSGFYVHTTHIVPGDDAIQEAWVNLGFGRGTVCATRETALPVAGARPLPSGTEIHRAGPEDIAVVERLDWILYEHHSLAPIFWPLLQEPRPTVRAETVRTLEIPSNAYFVAYQDGQPVAMQTFEEHGFMPSILEPKGNIYLHDGIVAPEVRHGGVGTALLDHAMAWARAAGHRWCTLHFASANASGAPFWLRHSFVPVEYTMSRHLDERVAYANAW